MKNWKNYFRGKKITLMGLGLLGRGVSDAAFLAEYGAKLIVTDLKTKEELAPSLRKLKKFKNIAYHLDGHRLEDFRNRDLIIKAAGVGLDSPFIAEARRHKIPIEMSTALFARFSPATLIGITGTRGKSTTTHLLHHLLTSAGKKVFLGGNIKGTATLPLLKKVKPGDSAILELDSWQLQGFGEAKISPHIAIFTNFLPDHLNYYQGNRARYFADKANIFRFQNRNDFVICDAAVSKRIKTKGKKIIAKPLLPSFSFNLKGTHNRKNAGLAVQTARLLGIPLEDIQRSLPTFSGVPGRLEFVRTVRGIEIYNDTTATTPDATIAGLKALGNKKNIILIMGGNHKNLDMRSLLKLIPRYTKKVILLPGTGTALLPESFKQKSILVGSLKDAVDAAMKNARRGDIILFSPAFTSFGLFKNEFDRGEQFNKIVRRLK